MAVVRKAANPSDEHVADLAHLGKVLYDQRAAFEWCGEFDTVLEDLNGKLKVAIPKPEPVVRVTVLQQFTVMLPYDPNESPRDNGYRARRLVQEMPFAEREELLKTATMAEGVYEVTARAMNV